MSKIGKDGIINNPKTSSFKIIFSYKTAIYLAANLKINYQCSFIKSIKNKHTSAKQPESKYVFIFQHEK